jgi:hypothetical protein
MRSTACFMAAETYVHVRSDGLHGLHNVCRPSATHAEQVLAEAYPISPLTNPCTNAVGRDVVHRQHARLGGLP